MSKKRQPKSPPRWTWITRRGERVEMVRLIYADVLRAYMQKPTVSDLTPEDTGYHTIRDYGAMRDYIKRKSLLLQVDYNEDAHECWISIPSPENKFYRTKLTTWNTILRRWPEFIDKEALKLLGKHDGW